MARGEWQQQQEEMYQRRVRSGEGEREERCAVGECEVTRRDFRRGMKDARGRAGGLCEGERAI